MEDDTYNYIIYHKHCYDGYAGFFLFLKTQSWTKKPFVYPDRPSSKVMPPNIAGKNVIIIDVAYDARLVKQIAETANKLLFIDHHVSIKDDIDNLNLQAPHTVVYNVNKSGASLVWQHFYGDKPVPKFVRLIEDNDTGTWAIPETKPFMAAMEVKYRTIPNYKSLKAWDNLLDDAVIDELIAAGQNYMEYKDHLIHRDARRYTLHKFPSKMVSELYTHDLNKEGEYTVAVLNGGCPSASLVGNFVINNVKCDFCVVWRYILDQKKYILSLRSKRKPGVDVSRIAKYFGGGGHHGASAFAFSGDLYHIDDLFTKID